ncbi:hypothetical protein P6F26_11490 [Roseibacterium sp. SDUM158017]|uniref:hypothetical protein n=1 Tax=Roseicyclus salinarum TaxID=3036773 RepID=UPI002414F275|nr:hypothetical protein [Roseibacterium sp. SDUM158017]MDG4649069.1 hypothetical protein [Roseibacterium sp. SDUM158017]
MRTDATRPNSESLNFARLPRLAVLAMAGFLAACAAGDPLEEDLPDMGAFRLSHNIVVADNMQQVPPSRNATPEEWEEILVAEIDRRFGAYEGDKLYHIGIAVDGYALAPPGIPVVLNPRSVLVLSVNVWDDALGRKLHDEPEQIMVFEGASAETMLVGSGYTRTREEQMQVLARNAARRIQLWMLQNPEWFEIDPDAAEAALAELDDDDEAAELPEGASSADAAADAGPDAGAAGDCVPTGDAPCPEPVVN